MSTDITIRVTTRDFDESPGVGPGLLVINHERDHVIGRMIPIDGRSILLGRDSPDWGPDLLSDGRLSRRHARITRDGDRISIEDLGSTNGTTLDGIPLPQKRPTLLSPGQVLGFGDLMLMVCEAPTGYTPTSHPRLVGISAAMAEVLDQIGRVAQHETTVLIQGETGSGKELVAKELHERSGRTGPLVSVHCGGVPDTLLSSELFGSVKGAFTGAERDRPGLVATAEGGTLFLDEIGEATPAFQVALLRLLQEGEYRPVGAATNRKAKVRVVAATHRDLDGMVEAGTFREDLHARLARWVIRVPALRERREDVPLLARHLARRHAQRPITLHRQLVGELLRHRWSKNVRELDAWMERAVVNAAGSDTLRPQAWMAEAVEVSVPRRKESRDSAPPKPRSPRPDADGMRALIATHRGNMKALAEALGVSRNTLYRWLGELGVDPHTMREQL